MGVGVRPLLLVASFDQQDRGHPSTRGRCEAFLSSKQTPDADLDEGLILKSKHQRTLALGLEVV
jgi:hypothetical protein